MESWRLTWRKGFVPVFSTAGLLRLLDFLERDDPRLTQGSTTTPPPLMCVQDWPLEAADAVALAAIEDFDCTVGEAEEAFAKACFNADQRLGEPAACRWFINYFDDAPRNEMRRELIAEVQAALLKRDAAAVIANSILDPALAAAVTADPEDRTLWLAASDWFREHGQESMADAIVLAHSVTEAAS